jgi:hypothetical protein
MLKAGLTLSAFVLMAILAIRDSNAQSDPSFKGK